MLLWDSVQRSVAICAAAMLPAAAALAQPFEFSFWPGPNATKDSRFLRMTAMQCGEQAVARVSSIPSEKESEALGTEPAILITPEGKQLRRWRMPANSFPVATSGTELIFLSSGEVFAVQPNGRVRRSIAPMPRDYGQDDPTCVLPQELSRGDFAYCRRFTDLKSKKSVLLAYVGPCS